MGQIIDFMLTPGNVDDRAPLKIETLHQETMGKDLWRQGLHREGFIQGSVLQRNSPCDLAEKEHENIYAYPVNGCDHA